MVLYYAFGGGLGHLTRATAVMHTLGYQDDNFFIITSSVYAKLIFKNDNIIFLPDEIYADSAGLKARIESIIHEYQITIFYIDSFPSGIKGELNNLKADNCNIIYVARLLNWENYSPYLSHSNLKFDITFIVENLPDNQLEFILNHSERSQYLKLNYPIQQNLNRIDSILSEIEPFFWLIVHSGDFNELDILYKNAMDIAEIEKSKPFFLVISQMDVQLNNLYGKQINFYPASGFFPYADKIFTACGFNLMTQTLPFAEKHHFIPFNRRFDDQFRRARNRKS